MFETLFDREKFKKNIKVTSIGCGNMIDYWGLVEVLVETRANNCMIMFKGLDLIDWNYKIQSRVQDIIKFEQDNAAAFLEQLTDLALMYIFSQNL